MDNLDEQGHDREAPIRMLLARAVKRARGSLLWERLWPALATLATALGVFLAFSWAGLWTVLPPLGRAIGLVLFGLLILAAAFPLLRLRVPSLHDGLRRLDRVSGEMHRPASAITDSIAANRADPVAQALWRAHVERALISARRFRAGWPAPRLAMRDPMALRALVLLLVVSTFFAAGGDRANRIAAAFDWDGVVTPANFRVDAWVTPPVYTGRPPVMLPGLRPGETASAAPPAGAIAVPAGSELVVRSTGDVNVELTRQGGIEDAAADPKAAPLPKGSEERRLVIKGDGTAALKAAGSTLAWSFNAIQDKPPTIALLKDPEQQARGSVKFEYRIDDDYGAVEAKATFALTKGEEETAAADSAKPARPLYDAPDFALTLPQGRARVGAAQTIHNLSEHPWAGSTVDLTLVARDEAGNEGKSEPHEFELPQRVFVKPLARALIEQRRNLAHDGNAKPLVLTALDALTIAPEKFTPEAGIYIGLRSIFYGLERASSDDQLRDIVTRLWDMAVHIEDGNMSDAEKALRQTQEELRQALERGATDEELKKLMENLRAAMDKFLQAMAEQMMKNPEQLARPLDRNSQQLRQQDLKSMLDRLEQMARSGNKEAAQRLLDQLQQMMENLQMARPNQGGEQGDDDMMSALDELSDMIRKQQQLRDRTFKEGQDARRNRQRQQRGEQGKQQMGDLRQDQQALRDRLQKLLEQLKQNGMGQPQPGEGQEGEQGGEMGQLGDAGEAMGNAEGQLGEGDADGAVGSQGRALDAMRKGAQGMAQAMQEGMGDGPGRQAGRNGQRRAQSETDPLGRPLRSQGMNDDVSVKVPGEIDVQRARRILEELRKRFGESFRPQLELDYIERLLKDF